MTNLTLPMKGAAAARPLSRLRRLVERIRRARADARARRALAELDSRTLRDIGLTRQDVVFFSFGRHRR